MAYATKYLFKWESSNGTTREIRVQKDGYSGSVIQRRLGRAPVLKKQRNGTVFGTSLEFYAECAVDGEFAEFYTSDPKAYKVLLYTGSTLLWQGYVTPELYSEPDIAPPYDVQVIATDGIGELKLYDFAAQGVKTLRQMFTYLLGYTGLGTDVYLISSMKAGSSGAGALLDKTINLDYKVGDTCYEVLTYLLDTLHATITWWRGAWIVARETNVTFSSNKVRYYNTSGNSALLTGSVVTLGKMYINDAWPVGQLTQKIDPAKKSVTIQAPWHVNDAFVNGPMDTDTGWTKTNNASWNSTKKGYNLPDNGQTTDLATVSQSISMLGMRVPMDFVGKFCASLISGQMYNGVAGVAVDYVTSGNVTYHLGKDSEGNPTWVSGSSGNTDYDFQIRLTAVDTDDANAEALSFTIPALAVGTSYPAGTLTVRIVGRSAIVFSASLDVVITKGYQDRLHIDNGARGEEGTVEIAIGRETSDIDYYKAFMQGLLLDSGSLITSFKDDNLTTATDFLSYISRDYARSFALPRIVRTGKVYLEDGVSYPPLVLSKGAVDYWLETFSWDMYEDELDISARSLPTATITVESEVIAEYGTGTASSSSSSGGGATPITPIPSVLPNPYALTFGNKSYDGSEPVTLTASDIGALTGITAAMVNAAYGFTISGTAGSTYNLGNLHTHSNKSVLDDITANNVNDWNAAALVAHSHSNKSVLDGITSSLITNWNTAYTNNHTHSNKSLLDSMTINWDNYFGIDSDGNVYVKKDGDNPRHFYSYGAVSAGGLSTGGGQAGGNASLSNITSVSTGGYKGDISASGVGSLTVYDTAAVDAKVAGAANLQKVWASLQNNDIETTYDSYKFAAAHLPALTANNGLTASYGSTTSGSGLADTLTIGVGSSYKLPLVTEWNAKADATALNDYALITNAVKYTADGSSIGSGSPFSGATAYVNATNLPNHNALVYNSSGYEYSMLFSFASYGFSNGTILRWGHNEKYLYIARLLSDAWQSNDWEKISAGYADDSGKLNGQSASYYATAADYLPKAGGTMSNTNLVTNLNADLWDGFEFNTNTNSDYNSITWKTLLFSATSGVSNRPLDDYTYGIRLKQAGEPNIYYTDIVTGLFTDALYYRRHTTNGYQSWKQIAFTDSNVASATQLQTSRNIFGQSFNGTADVTGWATATGYAFSGYQSSISHESIELYPDSSAGYGGFIDFHYNGSSADYTSRIIEAASGTLRINGNFYVPTSGNLSIYGYPTIYAGSNSQNLILRQNTSNYSCIRFYSDSRQDIDGAIHYFDGLSGVSGVVNIDASNGVSIGTWNSGAAQMFWDNQNHRLGLCNNTPAYTLDVTGTGRFTVDVIAPITRATYDNSIVVSGSDLATAHSTEAEFRSALAATRSYLGSTSGWGGWKAVISVRHRNGSSDGNSYGFCIYENMTGGGHADLRWDRHVNGSWQGSWLIWDNGNAGTSSFDWACKDLNASGNIVATGAVTAGSAQSSSDARLKANIRDFENPIRILKTLRAREWDWNEESNLEGHCAGLVAQEIEPYMPYVVGTIKDQSKYGSHLVLNYNALHGLEIAALQNHESRIDQLERENKELRREVSQLKARLTN